MTANNKDLIDAKAQVFYDGRWVPRQNFRVFVYNGASKKLANSYDEYTSLIATGLWFATLDAVADKAPVSIKSGRKPKHAAQTVKGFIQDSYQIISASSPTVPLVGNDVSKGIQFMNELLDEYSASALLLTIAKHITFTLPIAQQEVVFAPADYIPLPGELVVYNQRLANLQNAWLLLDNVTYPLIDESRNTFFASYKFDPQVGLPRFVIITNELEITRMRFYPAASQVYEVNVYGKFQLTPVGENDTMAFLPTYYRRYLRLALAKDLAIYKGRMQAWNQMLEDLLIAAKQEMMAASSVNLNIETEQESYLNGSWRVRAGV